MKTPVVYLASCAPAGGVYAYRMAGQNLEFVSKLPCDRPMFVDAGQEDVYILLRQPKEESRNSFLLHVPLEGEGIFGEPKEVCCTEGTVACHMSRFAGHIYGANYLSGSVFREDGVLHQRIGQGVSLPRQDGPHPHFIAPAPDGSCMLSTDLGLDRIYVYDKDLKVINTLSLPGGLGPRHLAWGNDGKTVFCVNELASSVTVLFLEGTSLRMWDTFPVLPVRAEGNKAGAVRVRGNYVYVSNRGADCISCLSWDGEALSLCSVTSSGGRTPWDLCFADDLLLCANYDDDCVTVFQVIGDRLIPTGTDIMIEKPICVCAV